MKTVTAKLATMRKAQEFVVYPRPTNVGADYNLVMVQSDKAIGRFDQTTGKGILNYKGSNSKYGHDLAPERGAIPFQFPQDFIDQCLDIQPKKGDVLCNGILTIG